MSSLRTGIELGRKCFSDLAAIDADTETYEEWMQLWQKLLEKSPGMSLLSHNFKQQTPDDWEQARVELHNSAKRTATPFLKALLAQANIQGVKTMSREGLIAKVTEFQF